MNNEKRRWSAAKQRRQISGEDELSFKSHTRIANIIVWHIETWYVFERNVNKTGRVLLGLKRMREDS